MSQRGGLRSVRGRLRPPAWQSVALLFVVLGAALAIWLEVLPALVRPAPSGASATDRLATELAHLKLLGRALRLHAEEHEGKYPPAISEIHWRQGLLGMNWDGMPAAVSRFHRLADGRPLEWLYYPGKTEADPPETILAASPVPVGARLDQRLVVRASGVAEVISEADFGRQAPGTAP